MQREMIRRKYSSKTIRTYTFMFKEFLHKIKLVKKKKKVYFLLKITISNAIIPNATRTSISIHTLIGISLPVLSK